jgi:hypothetical protein
LAHPAIQEEVMKFTAALIKEQNAVFAVVIVKQHVTQSAREAEQAAIAYQPHFPGIPIVLASQDSRGTFQYRGRTDLAKFLAGVDPSRIPWKEYTLR